MPSPEGKRQAASMKVGISNYVGGAALAVIGGAAALYTYISQTFDPCWLFNALMLAGLASLVLSIVLGGIGADEATAAVAADDWTMNSSGNSFNLQAVFTLLGLILVIVATLVGAGSDRRESSVEARLEALENEVQKLQRGRPGS